MPCDRDSALLVDVEDGGGGPLDLEWRISTSWGRQGKSFSPGLPKDQGSAETWVLVQWGFHLQDSRASLNQWEFVPAAIRN